MERNNSGLEKILFNPATENEKQRFIFVGENRSRTAQMKGYSWDECQKSNKPVNSAIKLFDAFSYCGLEPKEQIILNLWNDDGEPNDVVSKKLYEYVKNGEIIIGMGKKVQTELIRLCIPHRNLIHPAARGKFVSKTLYRKHFSEVVFG